MPPPVVLDLCCGTGDLALAILAEGAGRVVACDFSRPMLARAAAKFARKGLADRAALVEADALALPMPDASVDAATCGFGLRNLADPALGLAEMVRVVRPGGAVVLLEFYPPRGRGLLAAAFRLYFRRILPRLGAWVSGGDRGGYKYLADSIDAFRTRAEVAAAMEHAGLDRVRIEPLIGGIASVYAGTKP
jgi:demethylmenaquinone methyltransferase/2-methoxy-6-polyprenyl-1,4-benzoquinol methylase